MSELHLAVEVRDRIRAHADYTGPPDFTHRINCEWDEMVPAVGGLDWYIVVTSAGVTRGEYQDGGYATDRLYGIDVIIVLRAPKKPRDRQRDYWIELTKSFHYHQTRIDAQIDFDYTTINDANTQMIANGVAEDNGCEIFIEPLRWNQDTPIRPASSSIYAGKLGENVAALVRTIQYRGARRLVARS